MSTDRIEKRTVLQAPLERVWAAIGESTNFGTWFGMRLDGPFVEGAILSGEVAVTAVDDEIARRQQPCAGQAVTLWVVAVEPLRRLSFRWNAIPGNEFAHLTTLVEFTLTDTEDGVLLEIVESGFDALPDKYRVSTFEGNEQGWALQVLLVQKYLELARRGGEAG